MDWFIMTMIFLAGLVVGMGGAYLAYVRPVWGDYQRLVERMYRMKKQGFVPQYEVEQKRDIDPSEGIAEY